MTLLIPKDMNSESVYYISGPMSGYEKYNFPTFNRIQKYLQACGLNIESPHTNPLPKNIKEMNEKELWVHMMSLAIKQLNECDGIILIKGWTESRGANLELKAMIDKQGKVFYYDELMDQIISMNREN